MGPRCGWKRKKSQVSPCPVPARSPLFGAVSTSPLLVPVEEGVSPALAQEERGRAWLCSQRSTLKAGSQASGVRCSRSKDNLSVAGFPCFCRPDYCIYMDYFSMPFYFVCQCPIHVLGCRAASPFLSDEECCIVHPSLYQRSRNIFFPVFFPPIFPI